MLSLAKSLNTTQAAIVVFAGVALVLAILGVATAESLTARDYGLPLLCVGLIAGVLMDVVAEGPAKRVFGALHVGGIGLSIVLIVISQ